MTTTTLGIAAVSDRIGLPQDTVRWDEREGLIPRVRAQQRRLA